MPDTKPEIVSKRFRCNKHDATDIGRGTAVMSIGGAVAYLLNVGFGFGFGAEGMTALTVLCSVAVDAVHRFLRGGK
jgi:hypothetical protein